MDDELTPQQKAYRKNLERLRAQNMAPNQLRGQMQRLAQQQYQAGMRDLRSKYPAPLEDGDRRMSDLQEREYKLAQRQLEAQREYQRDLARYQNSLQIESLKRSAGMAPGYVADAPRMNEQRYGPPQALPYANPFAGAIPQGMLTRDAIRAQERIKQLEKAQQEGRMNPRAIANQMEQAQKDLGKTYKMFKKGGEVSKTGSTKTSKGKTTTMMKKKVSSKMMDMEGRALGRKTADAKGRAMKKVVPMPMGMKKGGAAKKKTMRKGK